MNGALIFIGLMILNFIAGVFMFPFRRERYHGEKSNTVRNALLGAIAVGIFKNRKGR